MIPFPQFRPLIVSPVLSYLNMHSLAAENLIVGTVLAESGLRAIAQGGGGPALGIAQMEPATHADIWRNYLSSRSILHTRVMDLLAPWPEPVKQLATNWAYAVAMARIHYWRVPESLPAADDLRGLGEYWKQHYNTPLGAGTVDHFCDAYTRVDGL